MDEDRAAALDWQAAQDDQCGGCGQPRSESMNPAFEYSYRSEAVACFSCLARARAAKQLSNHEAPQAVYYTTEVTTDARI